MRIRAISGICKWGSLEKETKCNWRIRFDTGFVDVSASYALAAGISHDYAHYHESGADAGPSSWTLGWLRGYDSKIKLPQRSCIQLPSSNDGDPAPALALRFCFVSDNNNDNKYCNNSFFFCWRWTWLSEESHVSESMCMTKRALIWGRKCLNWNSQAISSFVCSLARSCAGNWRQHGVRRYGESWRCRLTSSFSSNASAYF